MEKKMKCKLRNLDGEQIGEVELSSSIFGLQADPEILHRVVRWQLAKRQRGTHQTRTISMISGTTKKPYKQKGTGNARQGSLRSPQFRGGAVIFGPVVRSHAHELPKKLRKKALKVAISTKLAEDKLIILDKLSLEQPKTKIFNSKIKSLIPTSSLIIDSEIEQNVKLASRNLYDVDILPEIGMNVYDIIRRDYLVITQDAIAKLEARL